MQEFKPIKEGKVREVYDNGESLIIGSLTVEYSKKLSQVA